MSACCRSLTETAAHYHAHFFAVHIQNTFNQTRRACVVRARSPATASAARSLPQFAQAGVLLAVLLHDLGDGHLEVLLRHVHAPLAQRKHAGLCAAPLELGARCSRHHVGDLGQVDAACEVHLAGVDLEDVDARGLVGVRELNFAVNAARAQQRGVEDVNAVGCHEHLDLVGGFEAVKLVEQLKHGALDLRVAAAAAVVSPCRAD
eukprot:107350-Chlamydomonas_euryale.AAC.8